MLQFSKTEPTKSRHVQEQDEQLPWAGLGRDGSDIPTQKGNAEVLAEDGVEDEALETAGEQLGVPNAEATQQPCTLLLSPVTEAEESAEQVCLKNKTREPQKGPPFLPFLDQFTD